MIKKINSGSKLEEKLLDQITESGIELPQREFVFYKHRRWRADFAWIDSKLLVEVEGGIYGSRVKCHKCGALVMQRTNAGKFVPVFAGGRHNSAAGFEADVEKYNTAQEIGWRVIRATRKTILNGEAIALIKRMLTT